MKRIYKLWIVLIFTGAMAAQAGPSLSVTLDTTTPYAGVTLKNATINTTARVQSYTNDNLQEELAQGGYVEYKYYFEYDTSQGGTVSSPSPNPTAFIKGEGADTCNTSGSFSGPAGVGWIRVTVTAHTCDKYGNEIPGSSTQDIASITVAVFEITQSDDLWWFNGASPSNYEISISLTANGLSSGTFYWSIIQGGDKVTLQNVNSNPVTVSSFDKSTSYKDVEIRLTYNSLNIGTYYLTVFAPTNCEKMVGPADQQYCPGGIPLSGYVTSWIFQVQDQFGDALPNSIEVNESFGTWNDDYPNNNWPYPNNTAIWTYDTSLFQDAYTVYLPALLYTPGSVPPSDQNAYVLVMHAPQYYKAGSLTSGAGIQIEQHTARLHRGYGRQP